MILDFTKRYVLPTKELSTVFHDLLTSEDQVKSLLPKACFDSSYVAISGSMLEGFSHRSSDLDIYLVGDLKTDTHIKNIGHTRVDFECVNLGELRRLFSRLVEPPETDIADFDFEELQLMYRVAISQPLACSVISKASICPPVVCERLLLHMRRYWKYGVNTYLNDAVGASMSDALDYAYLRAITAFEAAIDYYLSLIGDFNPQNKQRILKLSRVFGDNSALLKLYRDFRSRWSDERQQLRQAVVEVIQATKFLLIQCDLFSVGSELLQLFLPNSKVERCQYLRLEKRLVVDSGGIEIASYLKCYPHEETIRFKGASAAGLVALLLNRDVYDISSQLMQLGVIDNVSTFIGHLNEAQQFLKEKRIVAPGVYHG